jgi:uncharacterized membrane protein YgdD (TMEM256/DUF423 family)
MAAASLLAAATLIGALGAHALKVKMSPDRFEVLQTAVYYQFFHATGLLGLGVALERTPSRALAAAAWLVLWGVLLFCGSLYLLLAGAPRLIGALTPLGGVCLIGGWCAAAWGWLPARAGSSA